MVIHNIECKMDLIIGTPRKEGYRTVQANFGSVEEMNVTGIQNYPLRPVYSMSKINRIRTKSIVCRRTEKKDLL